MNNIYQEAYDMVQAAIEDWYEVEINPYKRRPSDQVVMTDETVERKWRYVANYLLKNASEDIISIAAEKYPILQQIFQNNESEVRS
jgi:hypothetical protein